MTRDTITCGHCSAEVVRFMRLHYIGDGGKEQTEPICLPCFFREVSDEFWDLQNHLREEGKI